MNDSISMDIVDSLRELIKDLPNFIFFYLFIVRLRLRYEILEGATFAELHHNIHCVILAVYLEVQVSQDMDIVHVDESVDFVNDVLLLLGGNCRKGHLFYYH